MIERTCNACLVNDLMPGIIIDRSGICNLCRDWQSDPRNAALQEKQRLEFERDLEKTLRERRPGAKYDCILSFSGGKDSCYLLHRLVKEYKLRVLAYTSDFDIPETTWDNIRRTLRVLNVDHHVDTPSKELYRRFIRYLLQHQMQKGAVHTVCYFWLDIREGDLLKMACKKDIPLIITGYSPGQPDPARMLYEMPRDRIAQSWIPENMFTQGVFSPDERNLFWDPKRDASNDQLPRIIAPFHAWRYDQADVMEKVCELGLVKNRWHANPVVSNFTLNWLFMYSDLKNLGFNPYKPEFSQLIREGRANRKVWKTLFTAMDAMIRNRVLFGKHVNKSLRWLDLRADQLRIERSASVTTTHEAYQPNARESHATWLS